MGSATFGQQTKALIQKSWTFQKRNIGSNICLCVAPIFFCVILAIIQVLINKLFLSSGELKCGCYCQQCCPQWALTSSSNNYTADGNGTIIVPNPATFGGYPTMALLFGPQRMVNNSDGSVTVQTCGPVGSGACPSDLGYTCLMTDGNKCGVQFSTPSQSQWCAVPQPSVWPGVVQSVDQDERALPWGAANVNGTTVNRTATLITGATPTLVGQVSSGLFTGNISSDINLWKQALLGPNGLYTGNSTDPDQGNIYNGDWLSQLGLQFGTDANAQVNIYFERAFQPGQNLYVMMPVNLCVSKGITTSSSMCLSDFLKLYFANNPTANSTLLSLLPPCTGGRLAGQSSNQLLPTLYLQVYCTENAIVPMASSAALENTLYCGFYQSRCNGTSWENQKYQGAYDLQNSSATGINIQVYYNQSADLPANGAPPRLLRLPGPINTAVSAWWSTLPASSSGSIELLGVMSMPKQTSQLTLDFSSLLGPLFFTWVVQLLLPTFLQQLVYEKEKRLRMMMKMHGLGDVVYWLVTYLWYLILYIIYIIIFIVIGAIVRLNMFRKTNLGIQIIFYFLQGNCMIAFAFMLSSLFTSARTAVMVAFLYVFGSGLIAELLMQPFMAENKLWTFFVEWIPAFALYRGLLEMSAYSQVGVYKNEPGMQFSNLSDAGNGMLATWGIFVVEWALFLLIGIYLEQVVSSGTGIRRHPLYFINWMWKKKGNPLEQHDADHDRTSIDGKMAAMQQNASLAHSVSMGGGTVRDVEVERMRVERLTDTSDTPILVRDLKKVYPGLDGGPPKTAVRSMTLGVSRGECFGLLGPNGAGKTSFISVLVGFLEPTAGSAVIEGFDLRTEMQHVYKLMGVCPQHDLLWEELSGREHLRFYGRLKGLNGGELEEAIDAALKSVSLFSAGVGDKFAGKYSGGMKRRLSVAISFIGSPKVVYLDEPSTGLDPASRRNLWDVVRNNKDGRSIILTTHSMEEAEMLCDRLGIFVDGQLVCIGNPKEITSRYAGFFVFTISVPAHQEEAARQLVASMSPNAVLTYELGGTLKYELPTSDVTLSQVFARVNAAKDQLDIIDWGIANATLEEVFIKLAKSIGAQSKDS